MMRNLGLTADQFHNNFFKQTQIRSSESLQKIPVFFNSTAFTSSKKCLYTKPKILYPNLLVTFPLVMKWFLTGHSLCPLKTTGHCWPSKAICIGKFQLLSFKLTIIALWFRIATNRIVSTGPLARGSKRKKLAFTCRSCN